MRMRIRSMNSRLYINRASLMANEQYSWHAYELKVRGIKLLASKHHRASSSHIRQRVRSSTPQSIQLYQLAGAAAQLTL